jgi:hypothetical protein
VFAHEARALITRLDLVRSFALHETMVPAAALSLPAQVAIERFLAGGRRRLRREAQAYLAWLESPSSRLASVEEMQRRLTFLRLRFNTALSHFDIFSIALTQRSEHQTGVWLAGLDALATDSLSLGGGYFSPPPLICYLERGLGAAIRRARTRLPGGGDNPVAIIRVPRERMIGTGIAASLLHECGHQGAAQLHLVESLRRELVARRATSAMDAMAFACWYRWISEVVADLWSMANLGIGATLGLMAVVSLPRAFVFTRSDGVHPIPYVRVQLSCAIGRALFPHPQWDGLLRLWRAMYPLPREPETRRLLSALDASLPAFVELLVSHRPPTLRGKNLSEVLPVASRQPARLEALFRLWRAQPELMRRERPTLVLAVLGQARANGELGADRESHLLSQLFTSWALLSALHPPSVRTLGSEQGESEWQMHLTQDATQMSPLRPRSGSSALSRNRPMISPCGC